MNFDIKDGLYETVIQKEFTRFAEKNSDKWDALAEDCAVQMLEEIKFIIDDAKNYNELHDRIMKIVLFIDTPPYPKRKRR